MRAMDPKTDNRQFTAIMKWLALISGGMFLGALVFFLPAAIHRDRSTQWPRVPGVVRVTGLKTYLHKPHKEPSFTPTVCYTYTVEGIPRTSTRLDFADVRPVFREGEAIRWLESNYPVGKQVPVYYDPSNPDNAVLVPGAKDSIFICQWWLVTTAACCVSCLVLYLSRKRRTERTNLASPLL